jgi:uncharacterized metal-binding protein YceD (DUF177 family)
MTGNPADRKKPVIDAVLQLDTLHGLPRTIVVAPDPSVFAPLAKTIGVDDILACRAELRVTPHGDARAHVEGYASARIVQTCVVTLEPFEAEISEPLDLAFADSAEVARSEAEFRAALATDADPTTQIPESLIDGRIDLGALVQEFLALGVDPYPRKPGAVFAERGNDAPATPFAVLAALKGEKPRQT